MMRASKVAKNSAKRKPKVGGTGGKTKSGGWKPRRIVVIAMDAGEDGDAEALFAQASKRIGEGCFQGWSDGEAGRYVFQVTDL